MPALQANTTRPWPMRCCSWYLHICGTNNAVRTGSISSRTPGLYSRTQALLKRYYSTDLLAS